MKEACEFLRECGAFFVGTADEEGKPQLRPFGAAMEYEGSLFISTARGKRVYKQMKKNPFMQIAALKAGTREWIRISAMAAEEEDISVKERMLERCPALQKHFSSAEAEEFAVFRLEAPEIERY